MTAPSPFSAHNPHMQIAWDSTSLALLKQCHYRWYQQQYLQYRSRREAPPLTFGILYHSALELYDRLTAKGHEHETAVREAVRYCLEHTVKYVDQAICIKCGVEQPEGSTHCGTCGEATTTVSRPVEWESSDTKRNRRTLVRTVVWYLNHFKEDPAKTHILPSGEPAVELSFRFELDKKNRYGEPFILCGHFDKIVEYNGELWVLDRKTTGGTLYSDFFKGFTPDNQMSLYTFAAHVVFDVPVKGVIIDAAQVAVNFSRFQRGFAHRHPEQLNEWLEDTMWLLDEHERAAEAQHFAMNDMGCKLFGGCPFRDVCSQHPNMRESHRQSNFDKFEWNPLEVR